MPALLELDHVGLSYHTLAVQAINAYNGDEKNKEKLIKMVNLTDGGYVSKDKYRPKTGVKSETLSRYSATYFDQDANNQVMGYPVALLGFLKPYIKARF